MKTIKAKIVGNASKSMSKSNGGTYVLMNCEIIEGPAKAIGGIVAGTRTTLTKDAVVKELPVIGDIVILHRTSLPSRIAGQPDVNFFEISMSQDTMSDAEINDAFAGW